MRLENRMLGLGKMLTKTLEPCHKIVASLSAAAHCIVSWPVFTLTAFCPSLIILCFWLLFYVCCTRSWCYSKYVCNFPTVSSVCLQIFLHALCFSATTLSLYGFPIWFSVRKLKPMMNYDRQGQHNVRKFSNERCLRACRLAGGGKKNWISPKVLLPTRQRPGLPNDQSRHDAWKMKHGIQLSG